MSGLVLFIISCNDKLPLKQNEKEAYIISKRDSIQNLSSKIEYGHYGTANFILADTNKVYFYENYSCLAACAPPKDNRPIFIGLDTRDIIQLPAASIEEFIDLNFSRKTFQIISVASYTDTVKSPILEKMLSAFAKKRIPKFLVRRTTLEEEIVLYHKTHNLAYLPYEVEWDTTRINFESKEDVKNILKKSQEKFKK
ncbi:hypothetical protein [Flavobacterium microcysteis]|uniref:Uncharacterized protein n=1 Tax=Flavobacterium microcysteis TaxID=2596891 RepID=A0A501QJ97_9FLAO|nr:hypothetical protein [Flavobacterium microcysteis]TPD72056.1 hypothetical protein FJA49_03995 [Flavobacterium microcysteis]